MEDGPLMENDAQFVPKGAIAFFSALVLFYAAFWLLILGIMLARG